MKRARTIALITALYMVSAVPAQSQDIFSFIQNIAGNYALSWTDLDSRRNQLEAEINSAASTGKISAAVATDFRTDLTRLTNEVNQAKAGGRRLSITQSINFSNQINVMATSLGAAVEHRTTTLPDVDSLQLTLGTQIDTALAAGTISATTASQLKTELQQIATIEAAYKADTGGNLTPRQVELLGERLNTVKASIEQQVRIGQSAIPALTDRRTAIEAKIQTALSTGRITASEAELLRQDLARIQTQQTTFQGTTGILTGTQVLMIAQSLDLVDDKISARLGTSIGGTTISTLQVDTLREQIASRINQLVASGRLSNAAAAESLHSLDQINQLGVAYRQAVGGITVSQVDRLMSDLQRVNTRIDQQIAIGGGTIGGGTIGGGNTGGGFQVGSLPVISVRNFDDVRGYWGEPYVTELASRNVIGGFPNGTFAPNDEITRAQFAAIVVKALNLQPTTGGRSFVDVPSNHWAAGAIGAASNAGLIGGFPDGTFKPADNITRAQALVILSKALRNASGSTASLQAYTDASAVPDWAATNIAQAANAKIIVSFPNPSQIRPNALATRGEVAALMYQTLASLGANLPTLRIGVLDNRM